MIPRIPGYEPIMEIGHGGMGVVWLARQQSLDRRVAIKLLLPGEDAMVDLRRFRREARHVQELSHPGVVRLLDHDLDAPEPYLVFEYIEDAHTLAHVIFVERPPLGVALSLASEVADALAHAHERGIVHRDIKPGNVLLGADRRPRLIDLGLARSLLREESVQLTRSGEIVGTMAYMSPEQMTAAPADRRSDVYSFGLVLYELFAGRFVFSGDEHGVVKPLQRLSGVMPPITDFAPDTPPRLIALLARCLALDPDARPPSARPVAEELAEMLLVSGALTAPPPFDIKRVEVSGPITERLPDPRATRRLAAGLTLAATLAGLAGAALLKHARHSPAPPPIVRPAGALEVARRLAARLDTVRGELDERWLAACAHEHAALFRHGPAPAAADLLRERMTALGLLPLLSEFGPLASAYYADASIPEAERWGLRSSLCDVELFELFCDDRGLAVPWPTVRGRAGAWDAPVDPATLDLSGTQSWIAVESWYEDRFREGATGNVAFELPTDAGARRALIWFSTTAWTPGFAIEVLVNRRFRRLVTVDPRAPEPRAIELAARERRDAGAVTRDARATLLGDPSWHGRRGYVATWVPGGVLARDTAVRYRIIALPLGSSGMIDASLRERVVTLWGSGTLTSPASGSQ